VYGLVAQEKHHLINEDNDNQFHYHCMAQFSETKDFTDSNCFSLNYNGLNIRGNYQTTYSNELCRRYCMKEDLHAIEIGELHEQDHLSEVKNALYNQMILCEDITELTEKGIINIIQVPLLSKAKEILKEAKKERYCKEYNKTHFRFPRVCLWIIGTTSIGKSTYTEIIGQNKKGVYKKSKNKWWNNYYNEEVVIIEDLSSFNFDRDIYGASYIKDWSDDKMILGQRKNLSDTYLTYKYLIITSNLAPWELLRRDGEQYESSLDNYLDPLLRRFILKTLDNNGRLTDLKINDICFQTSSFFKNDRSDFLKFDYDEYQKRIKTIEEKMERIKSLEGNIREDVNKFLNKYDCKENDFDCDFGMKSKEEKEREEEEKRKINEKKETEEFKDFMNNLEEEEYIPREKEKKSFDVDEENERIFYEEE
jgi:hypothetical protein